MSRPTIADVATLAAVSKSTVSRVLNGETRQMRASTRQRVEEAIGHLGYRPSMVARSLTAHRSRTIGLLISDVANPYYAEVIHGVEDMALARGYSVFTCNTQYDLERARQLAASLADHQVDGAIVMSNIISNDLVEIMGRYGVPSVVVDWPLPHCEALVGRIGVDYFRGIEQAVAHLVLLGHRCIGHLSGPLAVRTSRDRKNAFAAALYLHGLNPDLAPIYQGTLSIDDGAAALDWFQAQRPRPTAVVAANDLGALGLLFAAPARGLRIPADLSLVGLDDIRLASQVTPALTTITIPRHRLGADAMTLLLRLVDREGSLEPRDCQQVVTTQLIVRASTAPAAEGRRTEVPWS